MTPTLPGRWQTRLALALVPGLPVTALFALFNRDGADALLLVLLYVALFGVAWDVLYIALQKLRWERDWPPLFQLAGGVAEGALLYTFLAVTGLPGIPGGAVPFGLFCAMYTTVWLAGFAATQGPLRAIFPRWRFSGGRLI
ncbi:MAG TPA: hypothetical protein VFD32_05170 [Dehalococcoidia bacterium]|nr:hypothetical protein [Dehalococcoidia bacterium]